jgi:coenzyme PQQ synthesis protein D (PqqD)
MKQVQPRARQESLVVKEVDGETLVYDRETDQAHCLNPTAASVWKKCDGRTSVRELARTLSAETNSAANEDLVWLALDQLEKVKLLDQPLQKPLGYLGGVSRRQVVRTLGVAAITLPLVTSIIVPTRAGGLSPKCCFEPPDCPEGFCCTDLDTLCEAPQKKCVICVDGVDDE